MDDWNQILQKFVDEGRITEEGLEQAQMEREAYVSGYRLKEMRKRAQVTQSDLAERMGITQGRVSAIERGDLKVLTFSVVLNYVAALGGELEVKAVFDDISVKLVLRS